MQDTYYYSKWSAIDGYKINFTIDTGFFLALKLTFSYFQQTNLYYTFIQSIEASYRGLRSLFQ